MSTSKNQYQKEITFEKICLLYKHLPPILAVNIVVSTTMCLGLWSVVSKTALLLWLFLISIVLALRLFSYFYYQRHFRPEKIKQFSLFLTLGSGITGLLWGIGSVILFPVSQLDYQLFILFVLVGMGAGSFSSLTTYLPTFYAFFPISMLPLSIYFFYQGEPIQLSLAIMTLAFIMALSYFALNINRTHTESLRLRFENTDLLEQLRQQKNAAELANVSKSKFLAAASHDLRQPLHALTLFTSVLDESIKDGSNRGVIDKIKSTVLSLQNLFNALLDISRLEAGVMKVEKTTFNLKRLFDILSNDFNPQASEKSIYILWPVCDYSVYSDQSLLEQILRNYISNAIRYTDAGKISITLETFDNLITISVIDTGMGIPEGDQKKIFHEFHQLNTLQRNSNEGIGLGLAIVQRSAKLLGHEINMQSQLSKGSSFSITVDLALNNSTDLVHEPSVELNKVALHHSLIVVVDDESNVLEGTKALLQLWGCDVITASNKTELMTYLEKTDRTPDGIIADYRLQENQTGFDVIHALHKKYHSAIPAVIVTGDIKSEQLLLSNTNQFQVLHKPVPAVKLRTFLHNVQCR